MQIDRTVVKTSWDLSSFVSHELTGLFKNFVWCNLKGLLKTSLDLSSFVWLKLTGLFKTSLDLSSFVWSKLTGLFKTSLEETKEFKVIKIERK